MVPDLAADAEGGAEACAGAVGAAAAAVLSGGADDFEGGAVFGCFGLGDEAWVFVLGAVAPDCGFLFAHQGDVGGWGGGLAGARGGAAAEGEVRGCGWSAVRGGGCGGHG